MADIGYARVSTSDQDEALQVDALNGAGCTRVFVDHASGAKADRPELAAALDWLRPGDRLVVWKLDRLGRSVSHLVGLLDDLGRRDVEFRSLTEGLDTSTPGGRLIFHVMAAIAEFERNLIRERTRAGLDAARARGRTGGRPWTLDEAGRAKARALYAARDPKLTTVADLARQLGVSRATFYRALED